MKKYNNELLKYGHKEGNTFKGLMPNTIEILGGIGSTNVSVKFHGVEAKGMDALEVVNVNDLFENYTPDFTQGKVVLLSNCNPTEPITVTSELILNLNGKKIVGPLLDENGVPTNDETKVSDSYGLWVKEGGMVTIDGKGVIESRNAKYSMAVWANGGKVTINGGTFINHGDGCDLIYASNGGYVEIYGGEFKATAYIGLEAGTGNAHSALNIKNADRENSDIVVYGGRFYGFDPANNVSEPNPSESWLTSHPNGFVAEGYESVEVEPNVWEVRKLN
jgi:hypothetical protein